MKVLIVGNGVAGISVAKELRAQEAALASDSLISPAHQGENPADRMDISVLARESYDYYSRIRLPEVFGGEFLAAELLALYKPSWYADHRIEVFLAREVVSLNRVARKVMLSTGEELDYDILILALGADPGRPSVPGSFLPGVCTVREYDDAARLRVRALASPQSAAVIGGGLLGLEAARHLQLLGVQKVSVLEVAPRLLPRQLDEAGAKLLKAKLEAMGMEIITDAQLKAFEGVDKLEGLRYAAGGEEKSLASSTCVVSMGVRPRLGLARSAGLATNRGIIVDRNLRTSDPSIYAVGDCAEFEGRVYGIIPAALEQAPACAAAILGQYTKPYTGTIPSNNLKVAGVDLFSAGAIEKKSDQEELTYSQSSELYERYLIEEGRLASAIIIGSKEKARKIKALMGKAVQAGDLLGLPKA